MTELGRVCARRRGTGRGARGRLRRVGSDQSCFRTPGHLRPLALPLHRPLPPRPPVGAVRHVRRAPAVRVPPPPPLRFGCCLSCWVGTATWPSTRTRSPPVFGCCRCWVGADEAKRAQLRVELNKVAGARREWPAVAARLRKWCAPETVQGLEKYVCMRWKPDALPKVQHRYHIEIVFYRYRAIYAARVSERRQAEPAALQEAGLTLAPPTPRIAPRAAAGASRCGAEPRAGAGGGGIARGGVRGRGLDGRAARHARDRRAAFALRG